MRNISITKISSGYLVEIPEFIPRPHFNDMSFNAAENSPITFATDSSGKTGENPNAAQKETGTPFIPNIPNLKFFATLDEIFTHLKSIEKNEPNPQEHSYQNLGRVELAASCVNSCMH